MAVDDDPFAQTEPERDQYGRPKIIQLKRGKPDLKSKPIPYTRVSTFAGWLDTGGGLLKWSLWNLAIGLGRNPDLAAMAGVFGPKYDNLSRHDKKALDGIVETAHDRAGGNEKAHHGTAVHAMTEPDTDPFIPEGMAADVASYHAALYQYGLEVVATEQFIANDTVKAAGTFDHIYETMIPLDFTGTGGPLLPPGYRLIGDKKTGKLHLDSQSIQLAVYANGDLYEWETGERTPHEASKDWGILVHIPKGEARTDLYLIDLQLGYAAAKLALKANEHRTRKDIGRAFPTGDAPAVTVPLGESLARGLAQSAAGDVVDLGSFAKYATEDDEVCGADCGKEAATVVDPIAAQLAEAQRQAAEIAAAEQRAREAAIARQEAAKTAQAATAPPDEMAEAVELVKDTLGAEDFTDPILARIAATMTADECAAIWRECTGAIPRTPWLAEYTEAVRAKYPNEVRKAA